MRLTGAEILIECLKEQGVDTIFGFPGGAVLNIYDALYKAKDEIRHILTSHEQGASHAADGYARATGKTGVCIATSGPGATNLVTGIATAYMDSVPMVAITGQVATSLLGKDSFQEVDITGITMPITKHNYIVKDVNKLADTVRDAFRIASSGRPGPVLIDICKDVTAAFAEYEPREPVMGEAVPLSVEGIGSGGSGGRHQLGQKTCDTVRRRIHIRSEQGTSDTGRESRDTCVDHIDGLGSFPGDHRLFMGLVGMHGTRTSNTAVSEADLFIAIGARFSDRVISNVSRFAPNARIMHIDIDPAEIGKT